MWTVLCRIYYFAEKIFAFSVSSEVVFTIYEEVDIKVLAFLIKRL